MQNGEQGFTRWLPGMPHSDSQSIRVAIQVRYKPGGNADGMWNPRPTESITLFPLCQFILV